MLLAAGLLQLMAMNHRDYVLYSRVAEVILGAAKSAMSWVYCYSSMLLN